MRKIATKRRSLRALAVLGAGTVLAFGGTVAASAATTLNAADAPTTVTAAPGSTVTVPVTIKEVGGSTVIKAPPAAAGDGMVFTAPPNTTFPAQSTVGTQYSTDGVTYGSTNLRLNNCVVSNAGKTLTCALSSANGSTTAWNSGSYHRFNPTVTVDANAPDDTLLTGSSTLTFTQTDGTQKTTSVGSLHVQTPPAPADFADAPKTVTAAPGSTVTVPVTIKNTGGSDGIVAPPGSAGDGMVFTAPPNTTFPAQSTVSSQYSTDGVTYNSTNLGLTNCVVSNAGKTLTCALSSANGSTTTWAAGAYRRFNPTVVVDPSAPHDTLLTGSSKLTFTSTDGTQYTTSVGSMHVQTPPVAGASLASPQGLGLAAGFGVAGAGAVLIVRRRRAGSPS